MALILASTSPFRKMLFENAGLIFETEAPAIDERAIEATLEGSGANASDVAEILAESKARNIAEKNPAKLVIGGDQTLSLEHRQFHKPNNMEEARQHLLDLSGKTHQLNSAIVIVRDDEVIWRHVSVAHMHMRKLDPAFIGRHLAEVGDIALKSVGSYQIEGRGIQLFEKIEGDYFTIVGVPMIPLLAKLRELGEIDG
ncbi:septum formation inhibitor Maf [Ahrensia marina]|uniref:7-methyl-GTP pyrophosphatase n=2 Tax=Ahrensia marina TaxID=1514904 RepID=A0A0N0E8A2_9HYPH|nr:septum formation inhibitor Maf [Ahrensia marina]